MFFWSFRGVIAFLVCFVFFASLFVWPDSRVAHAFHWRRRGLSRPSSLPWRSGPS